MGMCDVLNGYTKSKGIIQALRSMAPDVIVCDEIGTDEDCAAISSAGEQVGSALSGAAVNTGVKIIAAIHLDSTEGLLSQKRGRRILETGAFDKIVMLKGKHLPCEIGGIYNVLCDSAGNITTERAW